MPKSKHAASRIAGILSWTASVEYDPRDEAAINRRLTLQNT